MKMVLVFIALIVVGVGLGSLLVIQEVAHNAAVAQERETVDSSVTSLETDDSDEPSTDSLVEASEEEFGEVLP